MLPETWALMAFLLMVILVFVGIVYLVVHA
jgi:hypothetical protein